MAKTGGRFTQATARARISLDRRPVAHFLHIGKTAGTAVKEALKNAQDEARYRVVLHPHTVYLTRIPPTGYYFFCVRDPIERYVSAFLSRQRQGQPRYFVPWEEGEAAAFARFHSPDELGVSLGAGGTEQQDAEAAMRAIQQLRRSYWDWFKDPDYLKSRADHLLWIGRQESLDLKPLAATLGLEKLELPTDSTRANKNPNARPELSKGARQNLRQWYAKDYSFLELCDELHPVGGEDRGPQVPNRTLVGRVMSGRPFALRNADAIRLERVARQRHRAPRVHS
jgi:hypothetical protein